MITMFSFPNIYDSKYFVKIDSSNLIELLFVCDIYETIHDLLDQLFHQFLEHRLTQLLLPLLKPIPQLFNEPNLYNMIYFSA